jgi:hypothetical protein
VDKDHATRLGAALASAMGGFGDTPSVDISDMGVPAFDAFEEC